MSHNRYDHSCHGVAVDVFMQLTTSFRWREVREFFPPDDDSEPMDIVREDDSWIGLRCLENMTPTEWDFMALENPKCYQRFQHFRNYFGGRRYVIGSQKLPKWTAPTRWKHHKPETQKKESVPRPKKRVALIKVHSISQSRGLASVHRSKGQQILEALNRNGFTRIKTGCFVRLKHIAGPKSVSFFNHTTDSDHMWIQAIF